MGIPFIGKAIESVTSLVSEFIKDPDLAKELNTKINVKLIEFNNELIKAQSAVIVAEAQSESFLSSNWRPITMLTFVFIIFNNYILVPYATALGAEIPYLEIPPGMWTLLTTGLGGYVVGRSVEKGIKNWNNNKREK